MRLFVGIDISADIRKAITDYVSSLQEKQQSRDTKWVRPGSLHVTLKFIGESDKAAEIEQALRHVHSPKIAMHFKGVGFFTPKAPRVFWGGIDSEPELANLAELVDGALLPLGVSKEPFVYQDYQPHLTLARSGSGRPQGSPRDRNTANMYLLRNMLAGQPQPEFGTMTADEFILYRSETLAGGARYAPLARFPLA